MCILYVKRHLSRCGESCYDKYPRGGRKARANEYRRGTAAEYWNERACVLPARPALPARARARAPRPARHAYRHRPPTTAAAGAARACHARVTLRRCTPAPSHRRTVTRNPQHTTS
ncbi:unnamed protein product [Spodoptera exigua]|nr:unnamed protein product [Spodoptera exigua]